MACCAVPAMAQSFQPEARSKYISRITRDSVIIITGTTRSFTVDSPEDQGPVLTNIDVSMLGYYTDVSIKQLSPRRGVSIPTYKVMRHGIVQKDGPARSGDELHVTDGLGDGPVRKIYKVGAQEMALGGELEILQPAFTAGAAPRRLEIKFTAGQRSPDATVRIQFPAVVNVSLKNTLVNVIGRGFVRLDSLPLQSIGRTGTNYSYSKVGDADVSKAADGSTIITLRHLDLRPDNGADIILIVEEVRFAAPGKPDIKAEYTTAQPAVLTSPSAVAAITVKRGISDFAREPLKVKTYIETPELYTGASFRWAATGNPENIRLMQSLDNGKKWTPAKAVIRDGGATVSGLKPGMLYTFRLDVKGTGPSNTAKFFTGKMDISGFKPSGTDNTEVINTAIDSLYNLGGGTLLFSKGEYNVRTIHLRSNVYLYVSKDAVLKGMKGADAPEPTWFSDKKYRSGTSPTDPGPYDDPENYLTKQDVGHHYFNNAMFTGKRLDNIKIIGNGLITGNGNLVNSDKVMSNEPDNRADKIFSLKLCTNLEIGGIQRKEDLWYDAEKDEPYYATPDGGKDFNTDNMLKIERGGHFVLLATGTDNIHVHDTYFGKYSTGNVRDIYDFMACNNVEAVNIYSKVSSDDIVKPGSDCSLGFTRPATHYRVRNIIGDTNCNLFQIGSETADDITDLCVDNIYVLGANKAGFSISTNDGAHIKDVHLNCGHTGPIHARSKMLRTTAPFFISISNRGRVIGSTAGKYTFTESGKTRNELLVKNVNIGRVENIIINGIDISEVYSGSSYGGKRWKPFDGTQRRSTSIIAGYSLPESSAVQGGLDFRLPDGRHTGYIQNVQFTDVHIQDMGGNPADDAKAAPPELGVGQYNVGNLKTQPSYGLWARHVDGLTVKASSFNYKQRDGRYAIFLDDVKKAQLSGLKMVKSKDVQHVIGLKESPDADLSDIIYYNDTWNNSPQPLKPAELVKTP
ncbi:endopygalactorunase [Chitinophaga barathri]|uniref:Endopygalactorunase n=2 Tax=Chitinophaga barathri TaxID=1647451 RepID=A0A3N4MTN2_9BACT|nr:endopygalactorunase [Chitinophaga barathri]